MNHKFKEWAQLLDTFHNKFGIAFPNSANTKGMVEISGFLQRYADMPDDEPAANERPLRIGLVCSQMVTKAYADWHINNGMKWLNRVNVLEEALASELQRHLETKKELADARTYAQAVSTERSAYITKIADLEFKVDQLERAGITAQQASEEVIQVKRIRMFNVLTNYIDKALHLSNMQHRFMDHGHLNREESERRRSEFKESENELRKLMVENVQQELLK